MTRSSALRTWADGLYERYAADIAALIGADEIPAITVHVEHHGPGAAWTSGTDVFLSKQWFTQHPDDVGGVLHEFTHAIMRAPTYDETTIWLIEGLADYVRDAARPRRPLDASAPRARQSDGRLPNDGPLPPTRRTGAPGHRETPRRKP